MKTTSERGFTLVELLVAMIVSSALIYLLSEMIKLIQDGSLRSQTMSNHMLQEYRAMYILANAIENMLPPARDDPSHRIVTASNQFEFSTFPVASRAQWGITRARLIVQKSQPNKNALILDFFQTKSQEYASSSLSSHSLLSDIVSAEFHYLYRNSDGLGNTPDLSDQLPVLVTLIWSTADDPQTKKEFAMRPKLTVSGGCQINLTTGTCQ